MLNFQLNYNVNYTLNTEPPLLWTDYGQISNYR